jgi:preprotein translocase subunit YajC
LKDEQDSLQPGDVVMLPDGAVAAIDRIVGDDAYVIEWHKQVGRGPWIFPTSDLVRLS